MIIYYLTVKNLNLGKKYPSTSYCDNVKSDYISNQTYTALYNFTIWQNDAYKEYAAQKILYDSGNQTQYTETLVCFCEY